MTNDDGRPEDAERALRRLLAEDAEGLRPTPVPYAAILRQGRTERRRRTAAVAAAVVALALVPAAAYALTDLTRGEQRPSAAGPAPSTTAPAAPKPGTKPAPKGPGAPATPGQLVDGITFAQAAHGLEACLEFRRANHLDPRNPGPGRPDDYRILLAHRSTGDDNAPGDGTYVVAVPAAGRQGERLICSLKDGRANGLNASTPDADPGAGPVQPDVNGQKLYRQALVTSTGYRLPFRWGAIGTVDAAVAKVTVSYGGRTEAAALDHGWFAATGVLTDQPQRAPHIMGYDAAGAQVYDSDDDRSYDGGLS
ncbi:hypothetical protein [Streptomyces sp. NPDC093225]|uniref:hypothetical protein n=1 Tax=Streptomyces sp. NPDC093225 TaxID=3366034 RepID=UPI003815DA0E